MRIKYQNTKKPIELTRENFNIFKDEIAILGQGVCCIKTDADPEKSIVFSPVTGTDDAFTYFYFMTTISTRNNDKTYIVRDKRYILMTTGEAPLTVDENVLKNLPVLDISKFSVIEESSEVDPDEIAKQYIATYKYAKYNDDIFWFDLDKQIWVRLKTYDDYNILISKTNRKLIKSEKTQIMDSMQIYLYDLENTQLDKNLLLFKNNKVLNIMTSEVNDFDGTQFIINRLNANWYENATYPESDFYLNKVLNDVCGININANMSEARQRYKDLIIYLGYMLTDMEKQSGIILYGKAQNGKSTIARLISRVKNSAFNINVKSLLNDSHYTAGFYNDRILFIDELKPKMITEDFISTYNQLLGNRTSSIREMQKEPRTVYTNFASIVTANEISEQFFTNRALLRRTKVMNSMFPVVANLPPNINLDDEVQKQNNMDWLANYAIRAFIDNNYDISKLFYYDIKKWLGDQNPTANIFLKYLVATGLIDMNHEIIGSHEDFKRKLSMMRPLKQVLIFDRNYDWSSFDEQINIVFQFVFYMSELSCLGSIIRWSVTENDLVDIEEDL
jgi:hypothetical protein